MRFFELHFNPKLKEDLVFDSFCFEPENVYEKRLGSLFLVGELKNVLPQNLKFLNNLAAFLKKQYYSAPIKFSAEASLKESLKKTNEFLAQIAKNGDVSWLGNLNLAILNLVGLPKNCWEVNFTKLGEITILLLRNGQIIDIGKNLELSEIEPYPLKIFSNIVTGKLVEDDIVLLLTKEVFSAFSQKPNSFLEQIAKIQSFEEKKFREILKEKEEEFLKISGICLLCYLKEIPSKTQRLIQPIIFRPKLEKLSLKLIKKLKFFKFPKLSFPKFFISKFKKFRNKNLFPQFKLKFIPKKNLVLILGLIFFLGTGYLFFRGEKIKELELAQKVLEEVKSKEIEAKNFLILKDEKKANLLFQEAWRNILPQVKKDAPLQKEAISLKKEIEEQLFLLNKLEKSEEPDLFFEFQEKELLIPQKILVSKQELYFFNPFSSKVYKLDLASQSSSFLNAKKNLKAGTVFDDSILFFSNPNILLFLKNDQWQEKTLKMPSPAFSFDKISSFRSNIYFLDSKSGEIAEYSQFLIPQFWLSPGTKKAISAKSMAIDGSIWILTENKEIERYSKGFYKETLKLSLFPYLENPTKIWTSEKLPYFYLLEPSQNRIIILNKKGEIIKQYRSEKFDNLLDFAISEDGKTIYLLNGLKVYKILL